jgi:hypothetical protein
VFDGGSDGDLATPASSASALTFSACGSSMSFNTIRAPSAAN